jgi:hypothetical protein
MQTLTHTPYPVAQAMRVVLDTLSPQTPVAFDETFAPHEARALPPKLAFHSTPVHGRWWNMAACALSALSRQGVKQRLATQHPLDEIAQHWATQRTEKRLTVNWQFTTDNARATCKRFYPH